MAYSNRPLLCFGLRVGRESANTGAGLRSTVLRLALHTRLVSQMLQMSRSDDDHQVACQLLAK